MLRSEWRPRHMPLVLRVSAPLDTECLESGLAIEEVVGATDLIVLDLEQVVHRLFGMPFGIQRAPH